MKKLVALILSICFLLGFTSLIFASPTDNLISVFRLNNSLEDVVGGFNLNYSTATINATGFLDLGADFENYPVDKSQYIYSYPNSSFKLNDSFSAKLWLKPESFNDVNHCLLDNSYYTGGFYSGWNFLTRGNGSLFAWIFTNDSLTNYCSMSVGKNVDIGKWTMGTFVYDGTNNWMAIYINSTIAGNVSCTYQPVFRENYLGFSLGRVRSAGTCMAFDGIIDEVAILNRAITTEEIGAI